MVVDGRHQEYASSLTILTLGVFENNPSAYYCYKAAGFKEIEMENKIIIELLGEQWNCIEMEMVL